MSDPISIFLSQKCLQLSLDFTADDTILQKNGNLKFIIEKKRVELFVDALVFELNSLNLNKYKKDKYHDNH